MDRDLRKGEDNSRRDRLELLLGQTSELSPNSFPPTHELDQLHEEVISKNYGFVDPRDIEAFGMWYEELFGAANDAREADSRNGLHLWRDIYTEIRHKQLKIAHSSLDWDTAEGVIKLGEIAAAHMIEDIINSNVLEGVNPEDDVDYRQIDGLASMHVFLHDLVLLGYREYSGVSLIESMATIRSIVHETADIIIKNAKENMQINTGISMYLRSIYLIRSTLVLAGKKPNLGINVEWLEEELMVIYRDIEESISLLSEYGLPSNHLISSIHRMKAMEKEDISEGYYNYNFNGAPNILAIHELQTEIESNFANYSLN